MSRWPVGRGETPRRDGACAHEWRALPESGAYSCGACGARRPDCPHAWAWLAPRRRWTCRVCGAHTPEMAEPEP